MDKQQERLKLLESYSVRELTDELRRRIAELDEARALLAGTSTSGQPVRNSKMSEAKAAYWAAWHEYRAAHPDATVAQWRKTQKKGSTKR